MSGSGSDLLDPITNPNDWDVVIVNGMASPGVAKISGFKRSFGWDVKKGKGAKGSTVTLNEYPPAEGTIELTLWEPEHFEEWREFRDIWNYDPTKKPISAVDIFHPVLADISVDRVVCKEIGQIEAQGQGLFKVTISLIEYNPPPKKAATSTPTSSQSNANSKKAPGNTGDPVADELLRQIGVEKDRAKDPFAP